MFQEKIAILFESQAYNILPKETSGFHDMIVGNGYFLGKPAATLCWNDGYFTSWGKI